MLVHLDAALVPGSTSQEHTRARADPWRRFSGAAVFTDCSGPWTAGRRPLPDRGPCGPYPFLPVLPAEPRRLTKNKKIKKHMLLGASYVPERVHSFKLVPENRSLRAE